MKSIMPFPKPDNDQDRVISLHHYHILDTESEDPYDDITAMVAEITGSPISYISLIDSDRQWMKSMFGMPADFCQVPREVAFCNVTICQTSVIHVPDLTKFDYLKNHQFVVGEPHFRFYCGAPLINSEGFALGTLCALDFEVKDISVEKQQIMRKLASQVVSQMERQKNLREITDLSLELEHHRKRSESMLLNILPASFANELKEHGKVETKFHEQSTVLFADFIKFTELTRKVDPATLISQLDKHFTKFDQIAERYGVEKIKTIGDAYLCAAGVPQPRVNHELATVLVAIEIKNYIDSLEEDGSEPWKIRISLDSSALYSGAVGKKITFDIWGNARDRAENIGSHAPENSIVVTDYLSAKIKDFFELSPIPLENFSDQPIVHRIFKVDAIKKSFSINGEGKEPNKNLLNKLAEANGELYVKAIQ